MTQLTTRFPIPRDVLKPTPSVTQGRLRVFDYDQPTAFYYWDALQPAGVGWPEISRFALDVSESTWSVAVSHRSYDAVFYFAYAQKEPSDSSSANFESFLGRPIGLPKIGQVLARVVDAPPRRSLDFDFLG